MSASTFGPSDDGPGLRPFDRTSLEASLAEATRAAEAPRLLEPSAPEATRAVEPAGAEPMTAPSPSSAPLLPAVHAFGSNPLAGLGARLLEPPRPPALGGPLSARTPDELVARVDKRVGSWRKGLGIAGGGSGTAGGSPGVTGDPARSDAGRGRLDEPPPPITARPPGLKGLLPEAAAMLGVATAAVDVRRAGEPDEAEADAGADGHAPAADEAPVAAAPLPAWRPEDDDIMPLRRRSHRSRGAS